MNTRVNIFSMYMNFGATKSTVGEYFAGHKGRHDLLDGLQGTKALLRGNYEGGNI